MVKVALNTHNPLYFKNMIDNTRQYKGDVNLIDNS